MQTYQIILKSVPFLLVVAIWLWLKLYTRTIIRRSTLAGDNLTTTKKEIRGSLGPMVGKLFVAASVVSFGRHLGDNNPYVPVWMPYLISFLDIAMIPLIAHSLWLTIKRIKAIESNEPADEPDEHFPIKPDNDLKEEIH